MSDDSDHGEEEGVTLPIQEQSARDGQIGSSGKRALAQEIAISITLNRVKEHNYPFTECISLVPQTNCYLQSSIMVFEKAVWNFCI